MIPSKVISIIVQDVALALLTGGPISIPLLVLKVGKDVVENVPPEELESLIRAVANGSENFIKDLNHLLEYKFGSTLTNEEVKDFFEKIQLYGG